MMKKRISAIPPRCGARRPSASFATLGFEYRDGNVINGGQFVGWGRGDWGQDGRRGSWGRSLER